MVCVCDAISHEWWLKHEGEWNAASQEGNKRFEKICPWEPSLVEEYTRVLTEDGEMIQECLGNDLQDDY